MARSAKCTIIIGTNNTGKSTLTKSIIEKASNRALVVDYSGKAKIWNEYDWLHINRKEDCKNFEGIRRYPYSGYEDKTFEYIYKNVKQATIVFDDCANYIKQDVKKAHPYLKKILVDYRHIPLDLFFIVHSVNDLAPTIWGHAKEAIIGASQNLISGDRLKMLEDGNSFLNIQKSVNKEFHKKYKEGGTNHYGIFKRIKL